MTYDPHTALGTALAARFAPLAVTLAASRATPWASATFTGARHRYALRIAGPKPRISAVSDGLACDEFSLRGHIVADVIATDVEDVEGHTLLTVEALTVEAA